MGRVEKLLAEKTGRQSEPKAEGRVQQLLSEHGITMPKPTQPTPSQINRQDAAMIQSGTTRPSIDQQHRDHFAQSHPEYTGGVEGARTREAKTAVVQAQAKVDAAQAEVDKVKPKVPFTPASSYLTGGTPAAPSLPYAAAQQYDPSQAGAGKLYETLRTAQWDLRDRKDDYAAALAMQHAEKLPTDPEALKEMHRQAVEEEQAAAEIARQVPAGAYAEIGIATARGGVPYAAGPSGVRTLEQEEQWERQRDLAAKQGRVDTLAAAYYNTENRTNLERIGQDPIAEDTYLTALELKTDLDKLDMALTPPTTYNGMDSRGDSYRRELAEKYGEEDMEKLRGILDAQYQAGAEALSDSGFDVEKLAEYERRQRSQARAQKAREESKWFAREHPHMASVGTVLAKVGQGVEYARAALSEVGHSDPYDLDTYRPLDTSDMYLTNFDRTVRGEISRDLEENWGPVGSFAYQTGMSMADFLFASAVTGNFAGGGAASSNLALAIMGSSAAANTTMDAVERGLSNRQAVALGAIAGMAEVVTERVSLDTLLGKTGQGRSRLGYFLQNVITEGSEEAASDVINWTADILVSGSKAEWWQAIDRYMDQGEEGNQAFIHALTDKVQGIGLDALAGMISGGTLAGGNIAVDYAGQMYNAYTAQKTASTGEAGKYRLNKPYNVDMPTVPIIDLSMQDIPTQDGELPSTGNSLRNDAITRARKRLGLDERSAFYLPASNVMRDGNEYVLKITKAALNKMLSTQKGAVLPVESILVMDNLERIANNGVWFDSQGDRQKRQQVAGFDHLKTTVYIDGVPYVVDMRVRLVETVPGQGVDNVLYYFTPEEIVTIERVGTTSPTGERRALTMGSETVPTLNSIVPQTTPAVKPLAKTRSQLAREAQVLSDLPFVDLLGSYGRTGLTHLLESRRGDTITPQDLTEAYAEFYSAGFMGEPLHLDRLPVNASPKARLLTIGERIQAYYNGVNDFRAIGQRTDRGKTEKSAGTLQATGDDAIMKIKKTLSLEEAESDGEERQESREAFHARRAESAGGGFEIFAEDEAIAYGYARCVAVQAGTAGDILEELSALGIQGDVMDGALLKNRGGITTQEMVEDAATIGRRRVLINATTHDMPKNVAGHEAFHVWNGTDATEAFREAIQENLKYTSLEFLAFHDWIAAHYFGEEVDLANERQLQDFQEELFAYIAGGIHDGVSDDRLRPVFRDFEAVKAAWEALVKTQTSATGAMDTGESAGDIQRIYSRPPQSADDVQAEDRKKAEGSVDGLALQRGGKESRGKHPGKYWRPQLKSKEWELLNHKMETAGEQLDEATYWVYAEEKGTIVFAIYGIGDGTENTPLYASGGARAKVDGIRMKRFWEGTKYGVDESRATFDRWLSDLRSEERRDGGHLYDLADRGTDDEDVSLHRGQPGRNRR